MKITNQVGEGKIKDFHLKDGVLLYIERLCMPYFAELKKEVMKEAHNSTFTIHPDSTKMYHNLKLIFGRSAQKQMWPILWLGACLSRE